MGQKVCGIGGTKACNTDTMQESCQQESPTEHDVGGAVETCTQPLPMESAIGGGMVLLDMQIGEQPLSLGKQDVLSAGLADLPPGKAEKKHATIAHKTGCSPLRF